MNGDLVQLRVIEAVRRHGSVTAAAKELRYTQPSISHHLPGSRPRPAPGSSRRSAAASGSPRPASLLADRATEIIGRVDSAAAELSTLVGLDAGTGPARRVLLGA